MKKALALILAVCFLLLTLNVAFSVEQSANTGQQIIFEDGAQVYASPITCVNPFYEGVISEDDLVKPDESESSIATYSDPEYLTDIEAAGAVLREGLKQRVETISVYYITDFNICAADQKEEHQKLINAIFEVALKHTGNPTEGDYLRFQFAGYSESTSGYWDPEDEKGFYYFTFTYTVTYYTNTEQEAQLDREIQTVVSSLDLSAKTSYEKVCAIYDYICNNIKYDYDNLSDTSYFLKYTAYAALINKTAVCQGYANLFYRMALEAGVDARIVSGISGGGFHAWNIVKLGKKYYNLDSTWDAGRSTYSFFLKCDENFNDHTKNSSTDNIAIDYTSTEFTTAYPMSTTDYDPSAVTTALLSVTTTQAVPGEIANVSVLISENTGAEVIQFCLVYDSSQLEFVSCSEGSVMSGRSPTTNNVVNEAENKGRVYFAWEDITGITDGGSLLDLKFKLKDSLAVGNNIEVAIDYNDEKESSVIIGKSDGENQYEEIETETLNGNVEVVYGVSVSGTVTSFNSDTDDVTIQLFAGDASEATYTVTVNGNTAEYSIEGVAAGTYTMKVMKLNHVTREYTITISAGNVTQDVEIYLMGDVDLNGNIDVNDVNIMRQYLVGNLTSLSDIQLAVFDVTQDGVTDIADPNQILQYLVGNRASIY
ncbi:MAG: transglutaminase domain-containing protein [Oscillospiraceae bacterium]